MFIWKFLRLYSFYRGITFGRISFSEYVLDNNPWVKFEFSNTSVSLQFNTLPANLRNFCVSGGRPTEDGLVCMLFSLLKLGLSEDEPEGCGEGGMSMVR